MTSSREPRHSLCFRGSVSQASEPKIQRAHPSLLPEARGPGSRGRDPSAHPTSVNVCSWGRAPKTSLFVHGGPRWFIFLIKSRFLSSPPKSIGGTLILLPIFLFNTPQMPIKCFGVSAHDLNLYRYLAGRTAWREKQVYTFTARPGVGGEAVGDASPGSLGTFPLLRHKHAIHLKAHSFRFPNCRRKNCSPLLLLRRLIIMPLGSPCSDIPPQDPQPFTYPAPCPRYPPHSPLPPGGP